VQQVAHDQADGQGHGRHRQEVGEGQAADPAHAGRLPDRAHAEHDRAEDDRRDEHPDQRDEGRTEPLQAAGEVGKTKPTMMPRITATMTEM
jgi:hypothetical protein